MDLIEDSKNESDNDCRNNTGDAPAKDKLNEFELQLPESKKTLLEKLKSICKKFKF
jgi:hypothetical protein